MINTDTLSLVEKIGRLKNIIAEDLSGQDLKWSLFIAASRTFKYDSCLKPFPPQYVTDFGEKDINKLNEVINKVPSLQLFHQQLQEEPGSCDDEIIHLLYFVLVQLKDYNVKTIRDPNEMKEIIKRAPPSPTAKCPLPTHIFQVLSTDTSELKFQKFVSEYASGFAYHGSKMENFYSILNYGLQQHLNKTSLFGEGVYLSTELNVSILFSPLSSLWKNSIFGSIASGVVLCEYVDHPKYLTRHEKIGPERNNFSRQRREIPEKYLLITNNDIVRVRYILIYGERKRKKNVKSQQSWIQQNKSVALIITYGIVLVAVGLSQSPTTFLLKDYVVNTISHLCDYFHNLFANH